MAAEDQQEELYAESENALTQTVIQNRYVFWCLPHYLLHEDKMNYEQCIKLIGSFQTVEHFWRIYNHLIRPNDIRSRIDYHLFKAGIKPTWEDPQNRQGGKWTLQLKKGLTSKFWEEILLAIVGEQFDVGQEICGAVVSIRNSGDIISIWHKNADNLEAKNKIRDQMRRILRLPATIPIEYKRHIENLEYVSRKDGSEKVHAHPVVNNNPQTNAPGLHQQQYPPQQQQGGTNWRPNWKSNDNYNQNKTQGGQPLKLEASNSNDGTGNNYYNRQQQNRVNRPGWKQTGSPREGDEYQGNREGYAHRTGGNSSPRWKDEDGNVIDPNKRPVQGGGYGDNTQHQQQQQQGEHGQFRRRYDKFTSEYPNQPNNPGERKKNSSEAETDRWSRGHSLVKEDSA